MNENPIGPTGPNEVSGVTAGPSGVNGAAGSTGPRTIAGIQYPPGHIIDCVMLAYGKTANARKMTQEAIDSLHTSTHDYKFVVHVVESQAGDFVYNNAETIRPGHATFNYNAALNVGLAYCESDYILIANNDLVFHKGWIEAMMKVNADSMSPWTDNYIPHQTTKDKIIPGFRVGQELCGWCILVKKSVLDRIGKFDEQFDFWYQDNDYSMQLMRHQAQHVFVGTSYVSHLYSQSHKLLSPEELKAKTSGAQAKFEAKYMHPKICLAMMVRDEAANMPELLEQVRPLIDYWVIVDTGSQDDTKKIITEFFAKHNIPGELHDSVWTDDYGYHRSEVMRFADGHCDYIWMMDADDRIHGNLSFKGLVLDTYQLRMGDTFSHWRNQIFRSGLKWEYRDVRHEYAFSSLSKTGGRLEGDYWIEARTAGFRSKDPNKYRNDAAAIEKALVKEPNNARYWFYLAQSYFDCHDFINSRRCYEKRVSMGGWPEEQFYAAWRVGQCAIRLSAPDEDIIHLMTRAYEIRPNRAESLHMLSEYLRLKGRFALAYLYARTAASLPLPQNDVLFIFRDVYQWKALDEMAISGYYVGRFQESHDIFAGLLKENKFPPEQRKRLEANLGFAKAKLEGK